LVFAGLLVLGRSATYGNVTWTPTFHPAATPLQVIEHGRAPTPPMPAAPLKMDPLAAVKRSAADEVLAFSAGDEQGDGNGDSGDGKDVAKATLSSNAAHHDDAHGTANVSGAAGTAS